MLGERVGQVNLTDSPGYILNLSLFLVNDDLFFCLVATTTLAGMPNMSII
jgi:hypothetical protein